MAADARTGAPGNAPSQPQPAATPEVANLDAIKVEISRRFNDLRSELLDHREKTVDWWLVITAFLLTLFGIVAAIAALLSFKRFQKIEAEARENMESSRRHAEKAKNLVGQTKAARDEAKILVGMTAEVVRNDPDRARKAAENIQENPTASPIDQAVADAIRFQQQENIEEAIETWRAIAVIWKRTNKDLAALAWFSVGYLIQEYKKNSLETAINAYDKAIRLKPDYAEVYNNRGNAMCNLDRHEDAIADYDEALRLKADDAEAYYNRGVANANLGRYEEAIADYDSAIDLKLNLGNAYYGRGLVNVILNRVDEARRDFEAAISLARDAGDEALAGNVERALKLLSGEQAP